MQRDALLYAWTFAGGEMDRQRSRITGLLMLGLGMLMTLGLHACQVAQTPTQTPTQSVAPTTQPAQVATQPTELPAETKAIVASAAGKLTDPPRGDIRFVAISDLNSYYGATTYDPEVDKGIKLIPFWKPDMVLCSGDMVAGQDPTLSDAKLKEMWAGFDKQVGAPIRQMKLPYGFTVGNHDASSALGVTGQFLFKREREATAAYWQDPAHNPGVEFVNRFEFPFYYTFKFKDVFVLAWDGSSNHIPNDKLAWVEKALSSDAAKTAKIRILLGHLPLYAVTIGRNEPAEVMENTEALRAMLEKYKVHTYISGHDHGYYPAHKGNLQLLHMGILGSGPRPLLDGSTPRKAITVIDIKFDSPELTTYTTFDMQTLQPIEMKELPRSLTAHNGVVLRRDVEQLTAAERSTCEQALNAELCSA
jgi:Calcineurin-like phosphoesterase